MNKQGDRRKNIPFRITPNNNFFKKRESRSKEVVQPVKECVTQPGDVSVISSTHVKGEEKCCHKLVPLHPCVHHLTHTNMHIYSYTFHTHTMHHTHTHSHTLTLTPLDTLRTLTNTAIILKYS